MTGIGHPLFGVVDQPARTAARSGTSLTRHPEPPAAKIRVRLLLPTDPIAGAATDDGHSGHDGRIDM